MWNLLGFVNKIVYNKKCTMYNVSLLCWFDLIRYSKKKLKSRKIKIWENVPFFQNVTN